MTALFWWMSAAALACSVCFDPTEQNREAFIGTTLFLTMLPLALIGGGAWWLFKRYEEGDPSSL